MLGSSTSKSYTPEVTIAFKLTENTSLLLDQISFPLDVDDIGLLLPN